MSCEVQIADGFLQPGVPDNESERLEALRALDLLDTPPEDRFDRIGQIARTMFDVPVALITLIDKDRQFMKSSCGIPAENIPRNMAFCAHAILQDGIFEVPDMHLDDRFSAHPLVIGPPHVRYYVGAVIRDLCGLAMGTLCLLDLAPRRLDEKQRELLTQLAFVASEQLQRGQRERAVIEEAQSVARGSLESVRAVNRELQSSMRELGEALAQKEQAEVAKDRFLATMSHELRTPLNGVIGMCDALLESELDRDQRRCAEAAGRAGAQLGMLLSDILQYVQHDRAELPVRVAPCRVREAFAEVLDLHRSAADDKGIALTLTLHEDVPEIVESDEARLRQVLSVLVSNGVKFTTSGSVTVDVGYDAGALCVQCRDTGRGIAPEHHELIFEPFRQVDDDWNRESQGAGLGLAVCRRMASSMNGEVTVASAVDEGALFTLKIPAKAVAQLPSSPDDPLPEGLRDAKVLLVEDDRVNRIIAVRLLKKLQLVPSIACQGAEALELARQERFALVVMDIQMPVLDGLAATRALRAEGYDGPIVALSANALSTDVERCLEAGMDGHIAKPVRLDALKAGIRRVWELRASADRRIPAPGVIPVG